MPLGKDDFIQELIDQIGENKDELYSKYLAARGPGGGTFGGPGSPTAPLTTPDAVFTAPLRTDEEVKADVDKLAKDNQMEQFALKAGKVALTILIQAAKSGV